MPLNKPGLYSYIIFILVLLFLLYMWYRTWKNLNLYKKKLLNFTNVAKILGLELFVQNSPIKTPISLTGEKLKSSNDIQLLLEKGKDFCTIEQAQHKLIKGLVKRGIAYIACINLDKEDVSEYQFLDSLPFIAWVTDNKNQIIASNHLFEQINYAFNVNDTENEIIQIPIDGKLHYYKLAKNKLSPEHFLICAFDITLSYELEQKLKNYLIGYHKNLDFIPIAISVFDKDQQLVFTNQAFIKLFKLEEEFLAKKPPHRLLLEELRSHNRLPLSENWQNWRDELLKIYSNFAPTQYKWYLPDGTTLRVIAQPQPQGGVCWIYENLTPMLDMQLRYNKLIEHQSDTLDNLLEGIILFNSDGKILLSNSAFTSLWGLDLEFGIRGTHIKTLVEQFKILAKEENIELLENLPGRIAGFCDMRDLSKGQITLKNQQVLEYSICPMRSGQTMLLFIDITPKIIVQKALAEKNEALLLTDKLRNEFVRHISYDLLTPLTSIDGFTQLLLNNNANNLNARTKDYLTNIATETQHLNNLIQDMIDLASLNAGLMQLELSALNLEELVNISLKRTENTLLANNIACELNYEIAKDKNFYGDPKRIIQLLTNVLSYCALHAIHNEPIILKINLCDNMVCFKFITAGLVHNTNHLIELPLAQSICKLWGGNLEFIKYNINEQILCTLPLVSEE